MANIYEAMNVRQKLAKARLYFLNQKVQKSGKNMHLEFKYFELEDIVPPATRIFARVGLTTEIDFTDEGAVMKVYNVDNIEEAPMQFRVPYREVKPIVSNAGKEVTNPMQALNNISKKLDAISNAKLSMSGIEKIEDLTKSLNSLSNVKISSTISKRITEIGASLDSLDWSGVEKVEALSTALQNMQGIQIPNMRNITGNQTATPTGTAAPADPAGATNAGAAATAATSGITQYTSQITAAATQTRGFLGVLQGVGGVFSRAFSAVGGVALKAFQPALKGVSTAAKSAVNACKKLGSTIGSKLSSKVKQTTSGMGQLFSSLKRIAMYRAIRFFFAQLTAAMKEGIQNLYMYSSLMGGTFKGSKKLVLILSEKDFDDWFRSWFNGHCHYMSKLQRSNMLDL